MVRIGDGQYEDNLVQKYILYLFLCIAIPGTMIQSSANICPYNSRLNLLPLPKNNIGKSRNIEDKSGSEHLHPHRENNLQNKQLV